MNKTSEIYVAKHPNEAGRSIWLNDGSTTSLSLSIKIAACLLDEYRHDQLITPPHTHRIPLSVTFTKILPYDVFVAGNSLQGLLHTFLEMYQGW